MPLFAKHKFCNFLVAAATLSAGNISWASNNPQQHLEMLINPASSKNLTFDWPILRIGVGEYPAGPTGVTVFHFEKKVSVAIDTRGGGPGTVNAPYMDLGYDLPELDSIVFAGGSWYGLEATTAVASALKDDGLRDGDAFAQIPNIAMSVGSIIFDFGGRRLNEIYPDKQLAQTAFRAAKTGSFPLGARGAAASAVTGGLFGCNAHSGQGAAFKQIGDLKIAAFTVVNALGVITDRNGRVVSCYKDKAWPQDLKASELLSKHAYGEWSSPEKTDKKNTTISLIVTNQKLDPAELKRLAVQVHTSMARGIQPFASIFDGDVLYAVSTQELDKAVMPPVTLGVAAGEIMLDAILSSVPEQPRISPPIAEPIPALLRKNAIGKYQFSEKVSLEIESVDGRLFARATGSKPVFGITKTENTELLLAENNDLTVPGRYPLVFRFENNQLLINPGRWQQIGEKQRK